MEERVVVEGLTGGYRPNKPVLHDLHLKIRANELVGLIGLNGAGKSTTIKHILGLMEPHKGSVMINGNTITTDRETYRRSLAYIPETPILYEELTLWEHMELTALAYGIERKAFEERSKLLLDEFRMTKMKHWYPSHFSKGMRQKVMIICAFLIDPPVYIVDEPIVGLDPIGIQSFLQLLATKKKNGAAVLMSTHILATAERYCDRFIILNRGRIVLEGTLESMRAELNMPDATLDDIYIEMTKEESQ
ncbi:ABC transporter ATP-binding protein [Halalkalibacterium halodurans]|uniref:ABC transporter (ATP-binding protein) n=1 Tax=Halalkalibacterium halodurans (strain ATCC BAA-125 / DSM 18197 / FERM 7344 / JCM 9153 / C-125) TaxID=272558 RepID=Q9KDM1_HALH5|nr:ATP-binding cassette domain-containing protein [Halalkalibacterium halodurans]MED4173500.1 ABC transporter ATP-binding protein [Halalkalibacterium halodurans]BAB04910.1 ABC transporter (ATP-binding protein) [Halalkalibacterium halodurans C-125]